MRPAVATKRKIMKISVRTDEPGGTRQTVTAGGHHFTVDASVADGGGDEGPGAHDLYDSALGACKALTAIIYARRRKMPLEGVEVEVESDNSEERQGVYRMKATLHLQGPLTEAQRAELLRVAGKCPVHKLMTEVKTEIETVLAD